MKNYSTILLCIVIALTGCSTVVPVSAPFPTVPSILLEKPPALKPMDPTNTKASGLLITVVENYGTYYEVREKLLAWQQWYAEQKKIFENK